MMYAWYIIQFLIGYNLLLPAFLYLLFLLRKKKTYQPADITHEHRPDYAIIVTAYQEIAHIPETIQSIINLKYTNFLCYVVLDNCPDISSLQFDDERIILLRPDQKLGGNVRSHFYAIHRFRRRHDYLTIIDSDNLVEENYLDHLNVFFSRGFKAVQGLRAAKNLDSQYACLDAARDIYYHFYDGEVLFNIGSSATLAGSGMAFSVSLYEQCLGSKDVSGAGFDKVLQYEIIKRSNRIAFCEEAIVYDQKTTKSSQLVNQRARWINTWFKYFGYGFRLIGLGIKNASMNQLIFGIVLLRPPLFIFLLLSVLCLVVNLFFAPVLSLFWALSLFVFVLGFLLPLRGADARIVKALKHIPSFMFYQVLSLMHARNANKRSIATRHFE
jgi:cellulose synthase/poly-beta-1,6-N-acetylglucosamine synthase-like glycosyltransferase